MSIAVRCNTKLNYYNKIDRKLVHMSYFKSIFVRISSFYGNLCEMSSKRVERKMEERLNDLLPQLNYTHYTYRLLRLLFIRIRSAFRHSIENISRYKFSISFHATQNARPQFVENRRFCELSRTRWLVRYQNSKNLGNITWSELRILAVFAS